MSWNRVKRYFEENSKYLGLVGILICVCALCFLLGYYRGVTDCVAEQIIDCARGLNESAYYWVNLPYVEVLPP